jgi:hypothetical protein
MRSQLINLDFKIPLKTARWTPNLYSVTIRPSSAIAIMALLILFSFSPPEDEDSSAFFAGVAKI